MSLETQQVLGNKGHENNQNLRNRLVDLVKYTSVNAFEIILGKTRLMRSVRMIDIWENLIEDLKFQYGVGEIERLHTIEMMDGDKGILSWSFDHPIGGMIDG